MTTPTSRPSGHHDITAYLAVPSVRRMIDFYVAAFDALELFVVQATENLAYHAEIRIGDTVLALHEDLPGIARARPPARLGGTSATFTIWTPDVDAAFDRAVAAGATVDSPPENSYWGDRIARVTDPAGHGWSLAAHLNDVPVEEQRRQARAHHADHAGAATAAAAQPRREG
jgi:PhnB protein